jgi:hypothetical protein
MKRRKLELHKQTIRRLNDGALHKVRGGTGYMTSCGMPCGCDPPDPNQSLFDCGSPSQIYLVCPVY